MLMLERAESLVEEGRSVESWITAAVLATNAMELLQLQEPDLGRRAIRIRHKAEVLAEVQVATSFAVEERLRQIVVDTKEVCKAYQKGSEAIAAREAAMVIGQIQQIFSSVSRVEEADACNRRVILLLATIPHVVSEPGASQSASEDLACQLSLLKDWLLKLPRYYLAQLMQGFPQMGLAAVGWFFVIWIAAWWCDDTVEWRERTSTVLSWLLDTNAYSPSGNAPPVGRQVWLYPLSWFAMVLGVFHLGILISALYSRMSRK